MPKDKGPKFKEKSSDQPGSSDVEGPQKSVIVNYLPQTFTEKALQSLFAAAGSIESVKLMCDKKTGYSYGFGFVNFKEEAHASTAMEMFNGYQLENKKVKVSFARPSSEMIKGTNLYISNLPRDITPERLEEMFCRFGTVVHRTVLYDRITNLPRGVGFVRFQDRESANEAVKQMHEVVLEGTEEPIRVKFAEDHGKQKAKYLAGFQEGVSRRFYPY